MNKEKGSNPILALVARAVLMFLAMLSLLLLLFFKPVVVDGPSMKNTFSSHDYLVAAKYMTFKAHKGDITLVLLDNTRSTPGRLLIKRIVAVPGETVKIEKGQLFVNGNKIVEPYLGSNDFKNYGEVTLKKGEYYVLGDNRLDSIDSRTIGAVKEQELQGRIVFRVSPLSEFGSIQ